MELKRGILTMKRKLIGFICVVTVTLLFGVSVKAANFTDNQTVDSNKAWTIKFTSDVGFDTLTRQGITVTDSNGNTVNVGVQLGDDDKTIIVTAPQGGYTAGENYILNIGTKAHSSKGISLKKEYKLHFNIKDDNSVVTFKDANLEQLIRTVVDKPTGDICKSDIQNITSLDASSKNIKDISGIENLIDLQTLYLYNNKIDDISVLENLTNLTYLNLANTQISDISALSDLTNLQTLYLNNNVISDITPLKGLINLQTLWLNNDAIGDISALTNLIKLQSLYLANNIIADYSPVKGYYNNLTSKDFTLSGSSDVVTFKDKNLEKAIRSAINKSTGNITQNDVKKITSLTIMDDSIQDISGIENLTNLQTLCLYYNQISDISALKGLTNLQDLGLGANQISDISALSNLVNLQELDLNNNKISDITPLKGLTNLQTLWLDDNAISDINPLKELTNLQALGLGNNGISSSYKQLLENALPNCDITY